MRATKILKVTFLFFALFYSWNKFCKTFFREIILFRLLVLQQYLSKLFACEEVSKQTERIVGFRMIVKYINFSSSV